MQRICGANDCCGWYLRDELELLRAFERRHDLVERHRLELHTGVDRELGVAAHCCENKKAPAAVPGLKDRLRCKAALKRRPLLVHKIAMI